MSRADTWMPLYIGDYLADTMHLTAQQHGCYLLMLMHQWRNGPLADDDVQLAAIARVDLSVWKKLVAPVVRRFFEPTSAGLSQKRLAKERDRSASNSAKRAEAGRKGAASRWEDDDSDGGNQGAPPSPKDGNGNGGAMANAMASASLGHKQNDGTTCAQPSPSESKKEREPVASLPPSKSAAQPADEQFEAWWKIYPRKAGKGDARKAFASAVKRGASVGELTRAVSEQRWNPDPQFIPHGATWLNGERWQDDPTAAAPEAAKPASRNGFAQRVRQIEDGLFVAEPPANPFPDWPEQPKIGVTH